LEGSVNAQLIREGLAYAELYCTITLDLIHRMRQLVTDARDAKPGSGPPSTSPPPQASRSPAWPTCRPRSCSPSCTAGWSSTSRTATGLAAFDTWVRADPNRDQLLLPTGEVGNLHDLYTVGPGGIALAELPENVTFTS
jgi:hypothetical protein